MDSLLKKNMLYLDNCPNEISKDVTKNLLCEQWLSKLGLFSLRKGRPREGDVKLLRPQKGI